MATASKRSADYDPIEEALDIGYGVGRKEAAQRHKPRVEQARRGGQRHGAAEAKRQAESDRLRRAEKQRTAQARLRASRALRQEEDMARARRGAYRGGQAAARRAQEDAARQSRQTKPSTQTGQPAPAQLSAPNFQVPAFGGLGGNGFDRATSSRVIVVAVVISSIGVVARDAIAGGTPTKTTVKIGTETLAVPTHLRSLGGVFIMGTIALVVNEFSPGIGLLLGVGLLFDVGLSTMTGRAGLFNRLGHGMFGGSGQSLGTAIGSGAGSAVGQLPSGPNVAPAPRPQSPGSAIGRAAGGSLPLA